MSRRKRKSTYQRRYNKPLQKGRIYKTKDSKGGHYAKIYRKNTKKNKYWIIHFTDSDGRHRVKMKHQIDQALEAKKYSYVYTQPSIITYERFHDHYPRYNLRVHKDDRKLIKKIKRKNDENHEPAYAAQRVAPDANQSPSYVFNQTEYYKSSF